MNSLSPPLIRKTKTISTITQGIYFQWKNKKLYKKPKHKNKNIDKNIKLATYASRCIENEILMFLRKSSKIRGEISIDEPLNKDGDGNELLLSDILGTDPDITSRNFEDEVDKTLLRD